MNTTCFRCGTFRNRTRHKIGGINALDVPAPVTWFLSPVSQRTPCPCLPHPLLPACSCGGPPCCRPSSAFSQNLSLGSFEQMYCGSWLLYPWERKRARAFTSLRYLNDLKSGLLSAVASPCLVSSLPCGSKVKPSVSGFSGVHAVLVGGHICCVAATLGLIV